MSAPSSPAPASSTEGVPPFSSLGLPAQLLQALDAMGFVNPTPIQAACIPALLEGRDVVGQAQTGTGKTGAFALPILSRIDVTSKKTQALVLAPTRELAIQVAEAFAGFASHLPGFRVLPIYGGQSYTIQWRGLERGAHVVIGTPGRVIDHLERGTLVLDSISTLVLDEADEMLRMGFIDDVTTILEKAPPTRQLVLFSATMPPAIRSIAGKHQRDPVQIRAAHSQATADGIRQAFLPVNQDEKVPALQLLLETEQVDAMLVFVRTKVATAEVADRLIALGFRAAALSGDVTQALRERTIEQLRSGALDIVVATDVAARGLDVDRISHVVNYEIPSDPETYVHRIGRTGRAGRQGNAILFVEAREKGKLAMIERATRATIEVMRPPSVEEVNASRAKRFRERVLRELEAGGNFEFEPLIGELCDTCDVQPLAVAAALARIIQGSEPFLLTEPLVLDRSHLVRPAKYPAARAPEPTHIGAPSPLAPGRPARPAPAPEPSRPAPRAESRREEPEDSRGRPRPAYVDRPGYDDGPSSYRARPEAPAARAPAERAERAPYERPEPAYRSRTEAPVEVTAKPRKAPIRSEETARPAAPAAERPERAERKPRPEKAYAEKAYAEKPHAEATYSEKPKAAKAHAEKPHAEKPAIVEGKTLKRSPVRAEAPAEADGAAKPTKPATSKTGRLRPPIRGMEWFIIDVGVEHGATPQAIVGAIANESGLSGRQVGTIQLEPTTSFVELPLGMPGETFELLRNVWVANRKLDLRRLARPPIQREDKPLERPKAKVKKKY